MNKFALFAIRPAHCDPAPMACGLNHCSMLLHIYNHLTMLWFMRCRLQTADQDRQEVGLVFKRERYSDLFDKSLGFSSQAKPIPGRSKQVRKKSQMFEKQPVVDRATIPVICISYLLLYQTLFPGELFIQDETSCWWCPIFIGNYYIFS